LILKLYLKLVKKFNHEKYKDGDIPPILCNYLIRTDILKKQIEKIKHQCVFCYDSNNDSDDNNN